jgi:hypothetical protein
LFWSGISGQAIAVEILFSGGSFAAATKKIVTNSAVPKFLEWQKALKKFSGWPKIKNPEKFGTVNIFLRLGIMLLNI